MIQMRRKIRFLLLPASLLIAAGIWFFCCYESEEDKVIAKVKELAELVSKPAGEAPAAGLLRLAGADKVFAPRVTFDFRQEKLQGEMEAKEIPGRLAAYRQRIGSAVAGAADIDIISLSGDRAELCFSGTLTGTVSGGGRISEVREVEAELTKGDRGWRISRIAIRPVLER